MNSDKMLALKKLQLALKKLQLARKKLQLVGKKLMLACKTLANSNERWWWRGVERGAERRRAEHVSAFVRLRERWAG